MPEIVVEAQKRTETGKNENRRLRASGRIPGILYGAGRPSVALSVSPRDVATVLRSAAGSNTLFDIALGADEKRRVILKEFVVDPLHGKLVHADFYEVALDKVLAVKVHVELHGTPVGVKTQGGQLELVTRELEIECLPADIPEKISLEVSDLALGQYLRVSDLKLSEKLTLLTEPDVVIAHVVTPRAEEEAPVAEAAAAATPAEPEVVKKGKAEAEAPAPAAAEKKGAEKKPAEKKK